MHINTHFRKIVPLKKMFPFDSNDRAIYTSILWYSLADRSILTSVVLVYNCFTVNFKDSKIQDKLLYKLPFCTKKQLLLHKINNYI